MLKNCPDISGLIEVARGELSPAVLAHVKSCADCAWELGQQQSLQAALERASEEAVPEDERIMARVMAEFDRRRTVRPTVRWGWAAAVAAAICLGVWWDLRPAPAPVMARQQEAPFVNIPYTVPLAPEERAMVVRMRIPVTVLWSAGFHVRGVDPGAVIDADVVVSQDGRARAIRPVSGVSFD